jgi:hypothetical protein
MTPFVPWHIWRRVSGEPSEIVATVKARTEHEAITVWLRRVHGREWREWHPAHTTRVCLEYVATRVQPEAVSVSNEQPQNVNAACASCGSDPDDDCGCNVR